MKPIALITLLGLCVVVLAPSDVAARAGGGGSRGSRSFSSPARPTPTTPSNSPSRPTMSPSPTAVPRSGFPGGLLGGLAGFALGGLLGGLLFGGGWGGGFGLLDLLLVGGALLLLFRFMSRRVNPAAAYAPSGGGGGEAYTLEMPAEPTAAPDLERGLAHIRQMDPTFDPAFASDFARTTFAAIQAAVTARDMRPVSGRLTSRMYSELTAQCDRLRAAMQTNRVEAIDVQRAQLTEAWQEGGQDYVTVYVGGSLVDYTVDDTTGALVDGSRTPQDFEEFWTFTRAVGAHPWKLSAIQTG